MQDATSKQQTKQKYKPSHQQTGSPPHSSLAHQRKTNKQTNKQTKTQHRSHHIRSLHKHLEELKNKHTETNNTITEIKNIPEGINIRISEAERISEVEGKMVGITSEELNKIKRMKRAEDSLRDLWDHIRHTNI